MNDKFIEPEAKMVCFQAEYFSQYHTEEIFRAFADAIIPRSPELAEEYGKVQYFGALDLHTDEYLILSLNSYYIPIAKTTAEALDLASEQLVILSGDELILSAISALNRFTMMGYYSEWSGYGSTRLAAPDQRILEFYPLSWEQVGYPGPSLGYRALRRSVI
jgi:hypothetical protein